MTRNYSPTLAETAHATERAPHPISRFMARVTLLALGVALALATALPVQAKRGPVCALVLETAVADCPALVQQPGRWCLHFPGHPG